MGLLAIFIHVSPDSSAIFHGNALGGKQNLLLADVGETIQDVGAPLFKQFGVYEKPVTAINIGQGSAIAILFFPVVS